MALVTFEPGARTAWHTHPLGQTTIVTDGCGWMQCDGGPVEQIRPGDVVWFPPGEQHWHGDTARTALSHSAVQQELGGTNVEWLDLSVTTSTAGGRRHESGIALPAGGASRPIGPTHTQQQHR